MELRLKKTTQYIEDRQEVDKFPTEPIKFIKNHDMESELSVSSVRGLIKIRLDKWQDGPYGSIN